MTTRRSAPLVRRPRGRATAAAPQVALLVVLALVVAACGGGGGGAALPEVALDRLDGSGSVDLAASDGTPRVVNLWATWCVPCRRELPAFDEVAAAAGDEVEVLGVNVGDGPDAASELVDELGLTFPQLLDRDSEVTAALEVTNMPSTAFVDGDGEVVEVHAGALDAEELRAAIAEDLGVEVPAG